MSKKLNHFKKLETGSIKIRTVNTILIILCSFLNCLVFFISIQIKNKYDSIVSSMNDYSECNKAIFDLKNSSDFLTNQARLFVINQEPEFMNNYFYEIEKIQSRETALLIVEMTHQGDVADVHLRQALNESNYLAKKEYYSMKLVCEAINMPEKSIPDAIKKVNLTSGDKLLSDEAKIALAKDMVFDTEYLASKERIYFYTNAANSALVNTYISVQNENDSSIYMSFYHELAFVVILLIVCVLLYVLLIVLVLIPLKHNLLAIQTGCKMDVKGAYEVRYIAAAYNALCEKNAITASVLKHKAEHDPLTGLINRNAFDQIKTALMNSSEPIAYLLIDVDHFKEINDSYGHLAGDDVLKKLASMLEDRFRMTDYVARIGGDEFAVIMTKFGDNPQAIIQRKINDLNTRALHPDDDLAPFSISTGVSFSEKGYIPELVEKADKALYKVKENGRSNCSFYNDK